MLFSHPTGNANVRHALQAFNEAELLESFITAITHPGNVFFGRLGRTRIGADFRRRHYAPNCSHSLVNIRFENCVVCSVTKPAS